MKIPIKKLKLIMRYFCTYTNKCYLGKTKLMKLFYFLDFNHIKKYGSPVTYDKYIKMDYGPIPSTIMNLVNSVQDENSFLSDTIYIEKKENQSIQRIKCYKPFIDDDKKYFSETELKILERIVKKYKDSKKEIIMNDSHKEAPWKCTKFLQEIPYTMASKDKDCRVDREEIELMLRIANE